MANIIRFGGGVSRGSAISAPIMGVDFTWDGGDNTCQVIDEGSGNWQMRFLSSGNLKFLNNRLIDEFLVGGGGRGKGVYSQNSGSKYQAYAGGGGYTTTVKSVVLVAETVYPIVVGAGATSATAQAGTSSAFGASAAGGFSGGSAQRGKGGSGGSSALNSTAAGTVVAGGRDGADGSGGSLAGVGQGTTTRAFGEADGDLYASGGDAAIAAAGSITEPSPNTGDGGSANAASTVIQYSGASGIVIIRNHREEAAA